MRVRVDPYDPGWVQDFENIREDLSDALEGVAVRGIEHVGSTSVPGLAAKPVIDVDVIVPAGAVEAAIAALERRGYRRLGELGVPGRHALEALSGPARNVYVIVDGCLALRNHLAVRDVLRADPVARDEYGSLKTALAEGEWESIDGYVEAKSGFLQRVLRRAGLDEEELAAIDGVNRPVR